MIEGSERDVFILFQHWRSAIYQMLGLPSTPILHAA